MRILIEVPTYDGRIGRCTSESLWRLDKCGHQVDYRARQGYGCAMARNRIVADALNAQYDHVLMVDNDIELPQDALRNLLEHPNAPVAMGYYLNRYARGEERLTCVYKADVDGWEMYEASELRALRDAGVSEVRIKGGGMGCCLIDVNLLRMLPFPWFEWTDNGWTPQSADSVYELRDSFQSGGEDINFCNSVTARGLQIVADTRVSCGHEFRTVLYG